MDVIEILTLAIQQRKRIRFEYELVGRAVGARIGHPHAIFISTADNINIDIHKIDGLRTAPIKDFPHWRQYKIKHIVNVIILEEEFTVADGYNPNSKQYARVISKI